MKNSKILSNLKKDFIDLPWKNIGYIALFFVLVYFSTDFLNSAHLDLNKVFNGSFIDGIMHLGEVNYYLFKFPKFICTILIYMFTYWIIYGITNRTKMSCLVVSIGSLIFGIINYLITQVRGIAFTISDIFSLQTAINVSKGISLDIEENFIIGIILFIIAILWLIKFDTSKQECDAKERVLISIFGVTGILFFYCFSPLMDSVRIWDINKSYTESGAGLTAMKMLKDLDVEEPENYDKNIVLNLLNEYSGESINLTGDYPNVIIVMNESFADLSKIYNIQTSGDNLLYFHSFMNEENIISGTMHSSEYGGGTANVEYELLTQNSIAFLPTGSMPYQQYIASEVDSSLAAYFNDLSYNSYGIHSWNKSRI